MIKVDRKLQFEKGCEQWFSAQITSLFDKSVWMTRHLWKQKCTWLHSIILSSFCWWLPWTRSISILKLLNSTWLLLGSLAEDARGSRGGQLGHWADQAGGRCEADGPGLPPLRHLPRDRPAERAGAWRDGQHEGEAGQTWYSCFGAGTFLALTNSSTSKYDCACKDAMPHCLFC